MNTSEDFDEKVRIGLQCLAKCGALTAAVLLSVDGFYERNPEIERTRIGEAFLAGLYLDQLSSADLQSAAQPQNQTQKVA